MATDEAYIVLWASSVKIPHIHIKDERRRPNDGLGWTTMYDAGPALNQRGAFAVEDHSPKYTPLIDRRDKLDKLCWFSQSLITKV